MILSCFSKNLYRFVSSCNHNRLVSLNYDDNSTVSHRTTVHVFPFVRTTPLSLWDRIFKAADPDPRCPHYHSRSASAMTPLSLSLAVLLCLSVACADPIRVGRRGTLDSIGDYATAVGSLRNKFGYARLSNQKRLLGTDVTFSCVCPFPAS